MVGDTYTHADRNHLKTNKQLGQECDDDRIQAKTQLMFF